MGSIILTRLVGWKNMPMNRVAKLGQYRETTLGVVLHGKPLLQKCLAILLRKREALLLRVKWVGIKCTFSPLFLPYITLYGPIVRYQREYCSCSAYLAGPCSAINQQMTLVCLWRRVRQVNLIPISQVEMAKLARLSMLTVKKIFNTAP